MKPSRLLLAALLLTGVGCVPPVVIFLPEQPRPFQATPEDDPEVGRRLALESRRLLKVAGPEAMSKLIDALLDMGCTITASDPATRFVSFERIRKPPATPRVFRGYGYESAVEVGTLKLSPEGNGVTGLLVLTGKIHWRTQHQAIATEVIRRLSPEDHKRFLDELGARGI